MSMFIPRSIEEYGAISEQLIQQNKKLSEVQYYIEDSLEFIELPNVFSLRIHETPMFTRNGRGDKKYFEETRKVKCVVE